MLVPGDFGKGLSDYGQSQTTLGTSMIQSGASPDEIAAALAKNAAGDMPEGQDAVRGLMVAWAEFFGVPVSVLTADGEMTPQRAAEIVAGGIPTSEAKLIQYVAAKAFLVLVKESNTELAGMATPRHPLMADKIERSGDRLVVSQGPYPTCGHNSCGMVADTLGKPVDIVTLIEKMEPSKGGIDIFQVNLLFKSEGIAANPWVNRTVSDLSRYTAKGTPVVVRILDNSAGNTFSHFVVVDGVTVKNSIPVVAIRDPWGQQYFSPVVSIPVLVPRTF